jgi:small GTP-binding protein
MGDSFRIAVLGSGGVGKTCVILRFLRDTFNADYVPTIQDRFEKNYLYNNKNYKLIIIDTAGQDEMQSITNLAIKSADAYVIMYSCTSPLSFDEVDKFRDKVLQMAAASASPKIVVAGNKCDLDSERASGDRRAGQEQVGAVQVPVS